jgi:hypothetical protein
MVTLPVRTTSGETEEETSIGERPARERKMALGGVPAEPRAEHWTHEDRSLHEEDHEA